MNTISVRCQLAGLGTFPHPQGRQVVEAAVVENLIHDFNSLRSRLRRRFRGLPVFRGHPDDRLFAGREGHDDLAPAGWVKALSAADDGLYAEVELSSSAVDDIRAGRFTHLSPRWEMTARDDGLYTPTRLLSVGLTRRPNLPVPPLVLEDLPAAPEAAIDDGAEEARLALCALVSLPEETAWPAVVEALASRHREYAEAATEVSELRDELGTLQEQSERFYRLASEAEDTTIELRRKLSARDEDLAQERTKLIAAVLGRAVAEARVQPSEMATWRQRLAEDFDSAHEELARRTASLRTQSVLTPPRAPGPSRTPFLEAVYRHMEQHRLDFTQSWQAVRTLRPELFAQLTQQPSNATS